MLLVPCDGHAHVPVARARVVLSVRRCCARAECVAVVVAARAHLLAAAARLHLLGTDARDLRARSELTSSARINIKHVRASAGGRAGWLACWY